MDVILVLNMSTETTADNGFFSDLEQQFDKQYAEAAFQRVGMIATLAEMVDSDGFAHIQETFNSAYFTSVNVGIDESLHTPQPVVTAGQIRRFQRMHHDILDRTIDDSAEVADLAWLTLVKYASHPDTTQMHDHLYWDYVADPEATNRVNKTVTGIAVKAFYELTDPQKLIDIPGISQDEIALLVGYRDNLAQVTPNDPRYLNGFAIY